MSEFVSSLPWRFLTFPQLGSESRADTETAVDEGGNDPTSSVFEKQPPTECEFSCGSAEQRITNLKVVLLKRWGRLRTFKWNKRPLLLKGVGVLIVETPILYWVISQGRAQMFWGTVEFKDWLRMTQNYARSRGSAIEREEAFGQAAEKLTIRSDAAQLETTAQTSTSLKKWDATYGKWNNMGKKALLEVSGPLK